MRTEMGRNKRKRLEIALLIIEYTVLFMYMFTMRIDHDMPTAAALAELREEHAIVTNLDAQTLAAIDQTVESRIHGGETVLADAQLTADELAAIDAVGKVYQVTEWLRLVLIAIMIVVIIVDKLSRDKQEGALRGMKPWTFVLYSVLLAALLCGGYLAWAWFSVDAARVSGGLLAQALPEPLMREVAMRFVRNMAISVAIIAVFILILLAAIFIDMKKERDGEETGD